MHSSLSIAVVVAAVACGACHTLPTGPTGPMQEPVAIEAPAEVVARPGEQMTYRISIHGMEVGEMQISIGDPTRFDGKDAVVVQVRSQSSKLLAWLHPFDDTLTSWIDRATGRPLAFQVSELASPQDGDVEASEMRFAPGRFAVQGTRRGEPFSEEQVVQGDAFDIPSMFTFFRSWEDDRGAQVLVDVMRARNAWRAKIAIGGSENLTTALGELPVVRFDGEGHRLRRDGTPDPRSSTRRFSIWVTDDADRVPARMTAATDYGDVEVDLIAYRGP